MNTAVQYMPQCAFDTLAFANRLKTAGMDAKLAETQTTLQAEVFTEFLNSKVATKQDVTNANSELKEEIATVKTELTQVKSAIKQLQDDVKQLKDDVKQLKYDVKQLKDDVKQLKDDVDQIKINIEQIKISVERLKTEVLIKLSGVIIGCFTIFGTLMAVLVKAH